MSLHINRFIDLIKSHEARAQKDFTMTMREAKDLHADITKLLLILEATRVQKNNNNEVIKVEMAGGKF